MAKFVWSHDIILKFIEEIKLNKCLWQIKNKDYKDRKLKYATWCNVVDKVSSYRLFRYSRGYFREYEVENINRHTNVIP